MTSTLDSGPVAAATDRSARSTDNGCQANEKAQRTVQKCRVKPKHCLPTGHTRFRESRDSRFTTKIYSRNSWFTTKINSRHITLIALFNHIRIYVCICLQRRIHNIGYLFKRRYISSSGTEQKIKDTGLPSETSRAYARLYESTIASGATPIGSTDVPPIKIQSRSHGIRTT